MSNEREHTEQYSVIKFLVQINKTNTEIMKELTSVYGMHALKSTTVKKWAGRFQSGRELVCEDVRAGQPAIVCNVEKVKREIEDCQKTIRDVTDSTDISRTSMHKILLQNLEMVCLKLVLKVLMPELRKE